MAEQDRADLAEDAEDRRQHVIAAQIAIGEAYARSNISPAPLPLSEELRPTSKKSGQKDRYKDVSNKKAEGATYTPKILSDFVAQKIVEHADQAMLRSNLRILDPAIGDGELLISVLGELPDASAVEVYGFETDPASLDRAQERIRKLFPMTRLRFTQGDFLDFVLENFQKAHAPSLFGRKTTDPFDVIIANPPYVRTQIIGSQKAQILARSFGLTGRVDLYHAFVMAMARVLRPGGLAGIIVSNRFMTTKSGATIRAGIRHSFRLWHVWDLGDSKIFDAAVLPAVLLLEGTNSRSKSTPSFSSIYETEASATCTAPDPIRALSTHGVAELPDGRRFQIRHGQLDVSGSIDSIWRIETKASSDWLRTVSANTWGLFRDIGKIRVGVKTCADKIFIRHDWEGLPTDQYPELLRQLTTHHVGRRYRALRPTKDRRILYPHESVRGERRAVNLDHYPRSRAYLEQHRKGLEARTYVIEGGRKWFEIWVPQDPGAWDLPKLVFRDISAEPMFWIDQDRTIVNGDCYWIAAERPGSEELLWLAAAVANSTFCKAFYDHRFNNKLYAGRRRFITQYVEQFPLPDPTTPIARRIIGAAQDIYRMADDPRATELEQKLNQLVWEAFGLSVEKVGR